MTSRRARAAAISLGVLAFGVVAEAAPPRRIVSIIPSVTEMIFAMGAGPRLVGVGSFDRFPPEVSRIPRVGGLLDPNVERILSLKPDLVVLYNTQAELKRRLDRAGIPYYSYEHRALADVTATVRAVGVRIGLANAGARVAAGMERAIGEMRAKVAGLPHPRTMLVIGREPFSLRNIEVSGGYGFLHDILEAAGGEDAFGDIKQQLVQASTEMILARRPDVIIELRYSEGVRPADASRDLEAWNTLAAVPAVKNRRLHILVGDEFVVPGPRVVDAIRRMARTLHPELTW